jgi:TetR/AcrR family transcriptional regulator, transcriptional repressor for nem operon
MASPRRVGAETSKTRDHLLDCVERLMLRDGYAAVTYRAVAAEAGVTSGLVQYYFPAIDDLFLAAVRRRSEENLERLRAALRDRPEQPLRVLWEYSQEESTASLTTEFLALSNHRKSIRGVIAEFAEDVRKLQLSALRTPGAARSAPKLGDVPVDVLLFVITGIPKLLRLEEGVGVSSTHEDVVRAFERYLDAVEPVPGSDTKPRRRPRKTSRSRVP